MRIRPMRPSDAEAVAILTERLGYPSSASIVASQIAAIATRPADALLVATADGDDRPIGWIHVSQDETITAPATATIHGLVVDDAVRSRGIGSALLEAAEAWALGRGARTMTVRSRTTRERAHRFYERLGYVERKRSVVFERHLDG